MGNVTRVSERQTFATEAVRQCLKSVSDIPALGNPWKHFEIRELIPRSPGNYTLRIRIRGIDNAVRAFLSSLEANNGLSANCLLLVEGRPQRSWTFDCRQDGAKIHAELTKYEVI